jgi:polyisoprenyl-teichoic acid--peptidoglycan teichoic acid transferase
MGKNKKHLSSLKIIYVIATALLIAALFYNQILPDTISNVIKVILVLLLFILNIIHSRKGIIIFLSFIMFVSSGALIYSQYSINRLITPQNIETEIVTFVVLIDSELTSVDDMKNQTLGFATQMDEDLFAYVKTTLTEKIGPYTVAMATDDLDNLSKLYAKTIDVMALDNGMRDNLAEEDPEFESKTKIIYTLKKDTIKEETSIPIDTSKDSFIILISGVDSRSSGAVADKARSDVNILMVMNPLTHKVLTISIPRDTYTPLGCRTGALDKLTHSGVYGIDCTIKTIENLFDIKINYYVKVNFTAFTKIINVLGTIEVYSKYAFTLGPYEGDITYTFKTGMNTMTAEQALVFARERHALPSGDLQRGLNQQEVIKGIINKVIDPSTLLKIEKLISVTAKSVATNMDVDSVMNLVQDQISNNRPWDITTSALTGTGDYQPTYSMGSRLLYVSWPNQDALAELHSRIIAIMSPTEDLK